jgi:hypothetical protein
MKTEVLKTQIAFIIGHLVSYFVLGLPLKVITSTAIALSIGHLYGYYQAKTK